MTLLIALLLVVAGVIPTAIWYEHKLSQIEKECNRAYTEKKQLKKKLAKN